jgi:hypothetical protein
MFENRVLRRISEHRREKVTGGWRRLHKEEVHHFTLHQMLLANSTK